MPVQNGVYRIRLAGLSVKRPAVSFNGNCRDNVLVQSRIKASGQSDVLMTAPSEARGGIEQKCEQNSIARQSQK